MAFEAKAGVLLSCLNNHSCATKGLSPVVCFFDDNMRGTTTVTYTPTSHDLVRYSLVAAR